MSRVRWLIHKWLVKERKLCYWVGGLYDYVSVSLAFWSTNISVLNAFALLFMIIIYVGTHRFPIKYIRSNLFQAVKLHHINNILQTIKWDDTFVSSRPLWKNVYLKEGKGSWNMKITFRQLICYGGAHLKNLALRL